MQRAGNPKSNTNLPVRRPLKIITIVLTVTLAVTFIVVAIQYYFTSNLTKPWILVFFSYLMSALVVANVFLWTMYTIMFVRHGKASLQNTDLSDIIRDENGFPSLGTLQFLIWTFIVSFAFLAIFFIRWYYGVPLLPSSLPDNLLILMGISIAVPVVSTGVSKVKYGTMPSTTETLEDSDRRNLTSMLMENGKLTVFRFQMFAWTWITVVTYLIAFGSYTMDTLNMAAAKMQDPVKFLEIIKSLEIRDVPQIYVVLMGLSQGAYIGSKMVISNTFAISMIMPSKVSKDDITSGKMITIMGTNFGADTDKRIWFEPESPSDAEWIGPILPDPKFVSENSIRIELPKTLEADEKYYVRVESKGMLTDKRIKEDVDAIITVTLEPTTSKTK